MGGELHWIGGATWIFRVGDLTIACDPVLCPAGTVQHYGWFRSRRLEDPVYTSEDFRDVDLWLITHAHEDHLDAAGLAQISPTAHVVTHASALPTLRHRRARTVTVLNWRQSYHLTTKRCQMTIEAMPAIHGVNPVSAYFAGGVNGYWITIHSDSATGSVYATGDTVAAKPVLKALQGRRVDVLIPYMGAAKQGSLIMALTLSADMLRTLMEVVTPAVTIPVHFGTFEHYVEPISAVEQWGNRRIVILKPGSRCRVPFRRLSDG